MRKAFLFFHRWLGLAAALVVSFIGLSGAALVFRPELDTRLNSALLTAEARPQTASLQQALEAVQERYPKEKITLVFLARTPTQTQEWWLGKGETRVYTDPHDGRILGTRLERSDIFTTLYTAHTTLFLGERGESISGWCGLILCSLAISGLTLWIPRHKSGWRRAFWLHWKTNWKGRIYELHRVGGLYISAFLIATTLSGATLVWDDVAAALVKPLGIVKPPKAKVTKGNWLSLDELVNRANVAFPDGQITRVAFPKEAGAPVIVRKKLIEELHPNGMNNISLDPVTGKVLSISDTRKALLGQRLLNLRYPLHTGRWGGNFSRALAILVGLSPLLFSISGFLIWRNRTTKHRSKLRAKSRRNSTEVPSPSSMSNQTDSEVKIPSKPNGI